MNANQQGLSFIALLNEQFKCLDDFIFDNNRLIYLKTCHSTLNSDLIGVLQSEKVSIDSLIVANYVRFH